MSYRKSVCARLLVASTSLVLSGMTARAEVRVPAVFSSHMVLQRDLPVPLWGTAAPGEKVTVSFRRQEKSAAADANGKWLVRLAPLKAGGPDTLKISGTNTIELADVLVGEVWVGSGQSNMDGSADNYVQIDDVLAKMVSGGPYPQVRLFYENRWKESTPTNNLKFSALLLAFGLPLQKELGVPVGLMKSAQGATASRHWLGQEAFDADPACKEAVLKMTAVRGADKLLPSQLWGAIKVGGLYESRIRPMIPYGIRGVFWDQGEAGTDMAGVDQYTLMGALIRGWREDWGQGAFPFLYVQKPSGPGCAWDYDDPVTRLAQKFAPLPGNVPGAGAGQEVYSYLRIMRYPNTAMVTSSDLGIKNHPDNKSGYGARAARVAMGMVYGRKVEVYGPVYQSHKVEGDKVRVSFTHVGQGLAWRHGDKTSGLCRRRRDKEMVLGRCRDRRQDGGGIQ
ncbi:MAG: sialate O-acetylesterase [bacterium]